MSTVPYTVITCDYHDTNGPCPNEHASPRGLAGYLALDNARRAGWLLTTDNVPGAGDLCPRHARMAIPEIITIELLNPEEE